MFTFPYACANTATDLNTRTLTMRVQVTLHSEGMRVRDTFDM